MRMSDRPIVLASTSPYRRALLGRLGLEFDSLAPDVDETPLPGESPRSLVARLAEAKARTVAPATSGALVIGSDQVACNDGAILGKPGTRDRAIAQLERASGRRVEFYTGLCLLDARSDQAQVDCVSYRVHFRVLNRRQIEGYLDQEMPYNCAGSFKSEGLGVALFERMEGDDPSALIGLPLIRLVRMFEAAGLDVLVPQP